MGHFLEIWSVESFFPSEFKDFAEKLKFIYFIKLSNEK